MSIIDVRIKDILENRDQEGKYISELREAYPKMSGFSYDDACIPAIYKLEKAFPNINFEESDLTYLGKFAEEEERNQHEIGRLEGAIQAQKNGGRTVTKGERETLALEKSQKDILEEKGRDVLATFFSVCEGLNSCETLSPDFDLEEEVFSKMYEHRLELRPKNPVFQRYYERYKDYRREVEKTEKSITRIKKLTDEKEQLTAEVSSLRSSNDALTQQVTGLQKMLNKALTFCDTVRKSVFGRFFYKDGLKALDAPSDSEPSI